MIGAREYEKAEEREGKEWGEGKRKEEREEGMRELRNSQKSESVIQPAFC
jgi:hypothetical protein